MSNSGELRASRIIVTVHVTVLMPVIGRSGGHAHDNTNTEYTPRTPVDLFLFVISAIFLFNNRKSGKEHELGSNPPTSP